MSEKQSPTHSTRARTCLGPGFITGFAVLSDSLPGPTSWTAYWVVGKVGRLGHVRRLPFLKVRVPRSWEEIAARWLLASVT